jgi:hypothetical protein
MWTIGMAVLNCPRFLHYARNIPTNMLRPTAVATAPAERPGRGDVAFATGIRISGFGVRGFHLHRTLARIQRKFNENEGAAPFVCAPGAFVRLRSIETCPSAAESAAAAFRSRAGQGEARGRRFAATGRIRRPHRRHLGRTKRQPGRHFTAGECGQTDFGPAHVARIPKSGLMRSLPHGEPLHAAPVRGS